MTFISHSPAETEALGESWGRVAQPGWVIGLNGDLGVGKTQLVKGLARGLGFSGKVSSPTFTLLNEYAGRMSIFHIDLYRLETREQIVGAGLEEYLYQPPGAAIVEWAERWMGQPLSHSFRPGLRFRGVTLELIGETERRITYEDFGS